MSLNAELSYEEKIMNALSRVPRKRTDDVISRGKREFDAIRAVLAPLYAERDALAAELAELREGIAHLRDFFDLGEGLFTASNRFEHADTLLRNLAAQPQGERGKALLDALTEIAHYGVSVPLEMTQAQYDAYAARDMRRIAQAAVGGEQPDA